MVMDGDGDGDGDNDNDGDGDDDDDEFINLFCKAFFAFLMCDDDVIISRIVTGNMMVLLFSAEMLFNV